MKQEQVFLCESCGSIMEFDVKSQTLKCPHCGLSIEINHYEEQIIEHPLTIKAKQRLTVEEKETKTIQCQGCGAKLEVEQFDATIECPYCGSHYVIADMQEDGIIPDGVIPFRIDSNKLKEIFRNWIKKRWFAPNALKHLYQRDKFIGVYVPYWTFDAKIHCPYRGRGGRHRVERYRDSKGNEQTRTVIDWYPVTGVMDTFFDDIQVPASNRFQDELLEGIEPFSFQGLKSYSKEYLSGYVAENYSVALEDGHEEAKTEMKIQLENMAYEDILKRYDCADVIQISPRFSKETYKYILVPIYATSYHYKNKTYQVVVNGQNGRIKGEYPKSPVKITAMIIVIMLALLGIYMFSETDSKKEIGNTELNIEQQVVYRKVEVEQTALYTIDKKIENQLGGVVWDYFQDNLQM